MADDRKQLIVRSGSSVPARATASALMPTLSAEPHWFGPARSVAERNARFLEQDTRRIEAHTARTRAVASLLDARIDVAAKIADLENVLVEIQRQKDHERWRAEQRRDSEHLQVAYNVQISQATKEAELAKARERLIRAQRNCEAAARVKESEIDQWYHAAEARRNEAQAEFQDTAADLTRAASPEVVNKGGAAEIAQLFATLDHQIELEKARGNTEAVLALANARARLKAVA